jgi:hypothetical protein
LLRGLASRSEWGIANEMVDELEHWRAKQSKAGRQQWINRVIRMIRQQRLLEEGIMGDEYEYEF